MVRLSHHRSPPRIRISSVSDQSFRVRYLKRSRELYRRFLEQKPWIAILYKQFLNLHPGIRILEVGCGTGDFTRYLARLCSGPCEVIGVDNRKQSIRAAETDTKREHFSGTISFKIGDAFDIPMENNYSDLTCCRTLLMHLTDPTKAVREMTRVTRPNGLIAAIEGGRMTSILYPEDDEFTSLAYQANEAWLKAVKRIEGKEFRIGERLPNIFRQSGLVDIRAEIHADAWLHCDPRRRLTDMKDELRFEASLSKENRRRDRKYLESGGLSESRINQYYRIHDRRVRQLLSDDEKLRNDTHFYGATFILVTGRKYAPPN